MDHGGFLKKQPAYDAFFFREQAPAKVWSTAVHETLIHGSWELKKLEESGGGGGGGRDIERQITERKV